MAIIQALLAMLFRYTGRVLNMVFGWATILLFGKVSQEKQIYLTAISMGSVLWIIAALGIAFPAVATFLFSFVTLPSWVDRNWIRLAMLGLAFLLPAVIGVLSLYMLTPEQRPPGWRARSRILLKGYPYTFGLSLTLLLMIAFAPVMKLRDLARRWSSVHVPVLIRSRDYFSVLEDVRRALRAGGLENRTAPASWMLRFPTKVLTVFAGGGINNLVAERLTVIEAGPVEVLLHPSDMIVRGRPDAVAHARALLSENLTFTRAYMTWDKEANEIEDRLRRLWTDTQGSDKVPVFSSGNPLLKEVDRELHEKKLPYEEWEVLFRKKLLLERAMLRARIGSDGNSPAVVRENSEQEDGREAEAVGQRLSFVHWTAAAAGAAWVLWKGNRGHWSLRGAGRQWLDQFLRLGLNRDQKDELIQYLRSL